MEPDVFFLTFTAPSDDQNLNNTLEEIELMPGGKDIEVTEENKMQYLDLLVNYVLEHQLKQPFQCLKKGFFDIVSNSASLSYFHELELESLLCGIDGGEGFVEDLKKNANLTQGYNENSETIVNLWKVLKSYSADETRKFLQFVFMI